VLYHAVPQHASTNWVPVVGTDYSKIFSSGLAEIIPPPTYFSVPKNFKNNGLILIQDYSANYCYYYYYYYYINAKKQNLLEKPNKW
jgi:hypothetical protein